MVVWAGGLLVFLACLHLVSTGLLNAHHMPAWFRGDLWLSPKGFSDLGALPVEIGAFWLVWGSFGVPLGVLGALVAGLGRRGQAPPAYVAICVAVWGVTSAAVLEPSPFIAVLIPAGMLLVAARRRRGVAA